MTKRIFILIGIFVGFLGLLIALPTTPEMKPSRLAKNLPETLGDWRGQPREPGEAEKQKLAADTEFERMEYFDPAGILPSVEASIVFSGKNLSQSIHRPQVCLRAQGWTFVKEGDVSFQGILLNGKDLTMRELICRQPMMRQKDDGSVNWEPILRENGEPAYIWRSFYYTFFGYEQIVAGHYERTLLDMKDRILGGYDQRWAYATFSSFVTSKHVEQGFSIGKMQSMDEAGIRIHIETFLKELLPMVVADPGEGQDPSLEEGKRMGL